MPRVQNPEGTIAWVVKEIEAASSTTEAVDVLHRALQQYAVVWGKEHVRPPFRIVKSGSERRVDRVDKTSLDIDFWSYTKGFPGARFEILKVEFRDNNTRQLVYHFGREFMIPINKPIQYLMVGPLPKKGASHDLMSPIVRPGEAICFRSQFAHTTFDPNPEPSNPAYAWMITEDPNRGPLGISQEEDSAKVRDEDSPGSRHIEGKLIDDNLAMQALISWGISETLRSARQRLGWTLHETASKVGGATPSYLARIEDGSANPSVELLERLGARLELTLEELIPSTLLNIDQIYRKHSLLDKGGETVSLSRGFTAPGHLYGFAHRTLPQPPGQLNSHPGEQEGWIVMKGRYRFYFEKDGNDRRRFNWALEEGDVLFLDSGMKHAIVSDAPDSEIIQIVWSPWRLGYGNDIGISQESRSILLQPCVPALESNGKQNDPH